MSEQTVSIETIGGPSDAELFNSAVSDVQEQPKQEAAQEQTSQDERPRDEGGRFAKAEPKAEPVVQEQPLQVATDKPKAEQESTEAIPPWRLRELREARDNEAKRAQDAEARAAQFEAQLRQIHASQQQKQNPPPEMFSDPDAWQRHVFQHVNSETSKIRFEMSEDWARDKFGDEKVDSALKWAGSNLDESAKVRIQNSRSPYREMVKIFDERQTLQQIGGDLTAYRTKLQDEFLNDPAFMQKVAEKLRGQAPAQTRPVTQLPPSLNRAPGSAGNSAEGLNDADMSNEALFRNAIAR